MSTRKYKGELPRFTRAEFEDRAERARKLMTRAKLDGMMLTAEANMEYLSGFTSQFPAASPSRPWYFVFPQVGKPVGVIPTTGAENWRRTSWVEDVRTWRSPNPENEGLDILKEVIGGVRRRYGRFGFELGPETRLGMPVADLLRLKRMVRPFDMVDCSTVMRELRLIKSAAEIARMRRVCRIVCDAFDALPGMVEPGDTERDVMRKFKAEVSIRGADRTPYMMVRAGRNGVRSFIMGPTDRKMRPGDVLCIDAGCAYDGYYCDFNRNYAIGEPAKAVTRAHRILCDATDAGIAAARPGATAEDVFLAQAEVVVAGAGPEILGHMGRFGHGIGKVMTEPPSNKIGDKTRLVPGMTLTIEPGMTFKNGRLLIHEENLVVTEDGSRMLTRQEKRRMTVIPW